MLQTNRRNPTILFVEALNAEAVNAEAHGTWVLTGVRYSRPWQNDKSSIVVTAGALQLIRVVSVLTWLLSPVPIQATGVRLP